MRRNTLKGVSIKFAFVLSSISLASCGGGHSETSSASASDSSSGRVEKLAVATTTNWVAIPPTADPLIDGVVPKADADTKGMFSPILPWAINAIHLAQLPNGKLLGWGPRGDALSAQTYDLWDPTKGTDLASSHVVWDETAIPDSFCGSGSFLPSGKLLLGEGGNDGIAKSTTLFDPVAQKNTVQTTTYASQRWYATMIALPDGRALTVGARVRHQLP